MRALSSGALPVMMPMMRLAATAGLAASVTAIPTPGTLEGVGLSPEGLAQLASSVPEHIRSKPNGHAGSAFDCKVREYAYEYAQQLQSWRGADKMKEVYDSLELTTLCNQTFDATLFAPSPKAHTHVIPAGVLTAFVAAAGAPGGGNDAAAALNDQSLPFPTIHAAVEAVRASRATGQRAFVVLREGTHYLTRTLELGPEDSHTSFVNYPGEVTSMSGAKPITTDWKPHRIGAEDGSADIYVADMSKQGLKTIPGLRINGRRGVVRSTSTPCIPSRPPIARCTFSRQACIAECGLLNCETFCSESVIPEQRSRAFDLPKRLGD